MAGELIEVTGSDTAGTTEYVFYDNSGVYTLLGSDVEHNGRSCRFN